jgi:hypothetical protein
MLQHVVLKDFVGCATLHAHMFVLYDMYVGGPKRNQKRSLVGGPVVVHASAARFLLWRPFCISLPIGIVK